MHSDAHYSKAALNIELVILLKYMSEMTAHMNVRKQQLYLTQSDKLIRKTYLFNLMYFKSILQAPRSGFRYVFVSNQAFIFKCLGSALVLTKIVIAIFPAKRE